MRARPTRTHDHAVRFRRMSIVRSDPSCPSRLLVGGPAVRLCGFPEPAPPPSLAQAGPGLHCPSVSTYRRAGWRQTTRAKGLLMPKWAPWLHNLMMQDDASVPDNQDATSGTFKHALGDAALAVAFDFVEERICQKIEQQGIKLGRRNRKKVRLQLEKMLRNETLNSIKVSDWNWWGHQEVTIEFSDQDQQDLDALTSRLVEVAPSILTDSLLSMEAVVLKDLKRGWPKYKKALGRDMAGFRKRLTSSWGAGFSLLEMLITIATEAGNNWKGPPQFPNLAEAHRRLHARACQIANEIVTLLRHGYADGAMARWRTLHEIAIVMDFLCAHGDAAAKQYIDHQFVESRRATKGVPIKLCSLKSRGVVARRGSKNRAGLSGMC